MIKTSELRALSEEALQDKIHELLRDMFKYRSQRALGELKQTHLLKQDRRNIARIKSILTEKTSK